MSPHHRTAVVQGHEIFYRESGPDDAPVILLLHGFPSSSHMFRDLIPHLATAYRVIAPDHLGFGYSSAPSADEFAYTFDALAEITTEFAHALGLSRFAMYVHDYGAPIGLRVAASNPELVSAIVTQNGNAYRDGLVPEIWSPIEDFGAEPTAENTAIVGAAQTAEAIRWQYLHGVPDQSLVNPDAWRFDTTLMQRPGQRPIQLALIGDYASTIALYPRFQQYFRDSQVPLLAVWGEYDEIFGPDGARAFQRDLPDAEVQLLPTGHFALETHSVQIARLMHDFLRRVVPARTA